MADNLDGFGAMLSHKFVETCHPLAVPLLEQYNFFGTQLISPLQAAIRTCLVGRGNLGKLLEVRFRYMVHPSDMLTSLNLKTMRRITDSTVG